MAIKRNTDSVLICNPLNHDRLETIQAVLMSLAGQEGCDGEPYDQMMDAANHIENLERKLDRIYAANKTTCGVALLYQKVSPEQTVNKVICYLGTKHEGEDAYDLKAKAERYFAHHPEHNVENYGFSIVAWSVTEKAGTEVDR